MNKIIMSSVVLFITMTLHAQSIEYTKREKNEVREGPGSYYRLMGLILKGTAIPVLKKEGGWINFSTKQMKDLAKFNAGWLSKNCLSEKQLGKDIQNFKGGAGAMQVSQAAVAAAVRGFALRYGRTNPPTIDSLLSYSSDIFAPEEFENFKTSAESPKSRSAITPAEVKGVVEEEGITLQEEGIGLGIAARIAADGLINEPKLIKYANLLAALLIESTGAYDMPMRVYVRTSENLDAFALPGGYIFISKGLVNACEDEAEFAAVIAHEIVHVLFRHGLQEVQKRMPNIRMDEAMDELDREVGVKNNEAVQELEDFAIAAYETVVKPRLQSYEEEADRYAALILARTGYDPSAVARMILRIRDSIKPAEDLDKDNPFLKYDFQKRYKKLTSFIKESQLPTSGMTNAERLRAVTGR
ncbi:MAG: M48 family metalloprotease [bacterium]